MDRLHKLLTLAVLVYVGAQMGRAARSLNSSTTYRYTGGALDGMEVTTERVGRMGDYPAGDREHPG